MFSTASLRRGSPSAQHPPLPHLHRRQLQPPFVPGPMLTKSSAPPLPLSFSLSSPSRLSPRIQCIGSAQPYDSEFKLFTACSSGTSPDTLKIAIVGFGNFGQFLARTLTRQGHTVLAHSRSDHSHVAHHLGVRFFSDPNDLFEEHPEIILLCTSIISTGKFLKMLPFHRLKRSTLFVDVLSVKEFPKNLMLKVLPADFDIICSHPKFGPESAKLGWKDLFFVYEKVRIGGEDSRISRCEKFLDIFAREECAMVEMSCAEHDKYAAESQFITHTVGRVLQMLNLESTPINTRGYEKLLDLVENTAWDSFDLYYGLFMYNKNALSTLKRLNSALEALKDELFERLDDVARKQQYESDEEVDSLLDNSWMLKEGHNCSASKERASKSLRSQDTARWHINGRAHSLEQSSGSQSSNLKIAIIGFGNFGQFLARTLVRQGHRVLAHSRTDYSDVAESMGVAFFSDADDLCEEHPEVVLLCTSILSMETVLRSLPVQRLKRSTLFVDVLSVKEFPRSLFLQILPPYFDILCTHPMFGPESGKNGWQGLTFVYDKVRIGNEGESRCVRFLDAFAREGCRMEEMSCSEHDRHAAGSQFITHTVGRVLEKLKLESTPINTRGYETLLDLVENTAGDSFDLYYGLFLYNVNAMDQLERLDLAFESLNRQLLQRIHGMFRKQHSKDGVSSETVQRV